MVGKSRYILVDKLARGGMAEIYLGCYSADDGFKRVCCIKRILPHYSGEREYIEMFRDEAHICKRLQHANIVRVEGFEEVDNSYAIIMEFVDGSDLRKLLVACEKARRPIPIPIAIYIAAEAARGLHYAHTKVDEITRKPLSIVHRDVSPQNILVSFEGEIKITDFGIADADNKNTETKPGIVKGKYSYMSPEQITAKTVDARTDVFALAIVLWEMIAMERLFNGESDIATIQKVKNCEIKQLPRSLPSREHSVDDELERLILVGLQKDVKKRYPDAKQFEIYLRKYLSKRYPSFGPGEVSSFLGQLLKEEKERSAIAVKKALTATHPDPESVPDKSLLDRPIGSVAPIARSNGSTAGRRSEVKPVSTGLHAQHGAGGRGSSLTEDPGTGRRSSHSSRTEGPGRSGRSPTRSATRSATRSTMRSGSHAGMTSNSRLVVMALSVVAMIGVGAFVAKRFSASRGPVLVTISTVPKVVKMTLAGKNIRGGRYFSTPLHQKLLPGRYELKVGRDGFASQKETITVPSGVPKSHVDIVLRKTGRFAPVKISVGDGFSGKVWFEIDHGVSSGFVPKMVDDITYGKAHTLRVYPHYPSKTKKFSCSFRPRSKSWQRPYVVVIFPKTKKCSYYAPR